MDIGYYIENKKEESAVEKLLSVVRESDPSLRFDYSVEEFQGLKRYYLDDEWSGGVSVPLSPLRKGYLRDVYWRSMDPNYRRPTAPGEVYFPVRIYSLGYSRYDSMVNRVWERFLIEFFFNFYFIEAQIAIGSDGESGFLRYADSWSSLAAHRFPFPFSWLKASSVDSVSKRVRSAYQKVFTDMKMVRALNRMFEGFSETYKKELRDCKRQFKSEFEQIRSKDDFLLWFGMDKDGRACHYCGISENEVNHLIQSDLIHTKRIYSRGSTMEVDQLVPYAGYSKENTVLACYWCNNAKTDEFSMDEFKAIAVEIRKIWENRLNKVDMSDLRKHS